MNEECNESKFKNSYLFLSFDLWFVTASAQKGITVRRRFLTVMVRQSLNLML